MNASLSPSSPLARLQRLAQRSSQHERCELCGAEIGDEHSHLLEPEARQLKCVCQACSILFSGGAGQRYKHVPQRLDRLDDLQLPPGWFESLPVPINLAFFYRSSAAGKVLAVYPSPAGATEAVLPEGAWETLADLPPLAADAEALLVNHLGSHRDLFLVSIDECYRLVGIVRSNWRGLSGGTELWKAVEDYFADLHRRARRG